MAQGDLLCPQESAIHLMKFQDVQDVPCDGGHLELLVAASKFF